MTGWRAFGMQDVERARQNEPDSRFQIASVSKFPSGDQITIHHLLSHTSGISDINRSPGSCAIAKRYLALVIQKS